MSRRPLVLLQDAAANTCPLLLLRVASARARPPSCPRPRRSPTAAPALTGPRQLARARPWPRRSPTAAPELADRRGERAELRRTSPEMGAHPRRRCSPGAQLPPRQMHSRRETIHFYLSSILTMQNAYCFACSVRAPFGDEQCRSGGIYAFAYHCWSRSEMCKRNVVTGLLVYGSAVWLRFTVNFGDF